MLRTANPALNGKVFESVAGRSDARKMTVASTVTKTIALILIAVISAGWMWNLYFSGGNYMPYFIGGALGSLVVGLITVFFKKASPYTAPVYAVLKGLMLGGFSAMAEVYVNQRLKAEGLPGGEGIVVLAVACTFGTFFSLLFIYKTGIVKVTQRFRAGVFAATLGIAVVYGVTILMSFFGVRIPYIHESGAIGIAFSVFVVIVAALNLILDFDLIERGAKAGAPKYMEWYAAFGLLVTLAWLYIEILRLLMKIIGRRR